ncbi:MAG: putative DNA binding domain-containing protein [Planctomycetaceae bacterium]|jgi:ATP-dependent DNA helicase RecG|nr:putative DNA binding domain-containing protein [Planctomycetaceae bacterium]
MQENQNIEYKSIWKDEYLKWICGFANANGGVLYIGKNDNGNVIGVKNAKKLLEDLPNKITAILGIVVDVNLCETEQGDFIEIVVEPQLNPVNYKGEYHYRSGATKQELKGAALDKFLLQKQGRRWDSVPVPNVSISDLKQDTFTFFKEKGIQSKRLDEKSRRDTNEQFIDNLQLRENKYLKRAALLLFHPTPEKFVTGAYVKIGYFQTDCDLLFQDDIHGNLFEQVEKTMALLLTKYIKALISYKRLSRIETYEYPEEALREALLNAIVHKDYSGGVPVQIRVYQDKMLFWNHGQLPENWTIETLLGVHPSLPHNPDIANAFFRSGYIESWGRGIEKMIDHCQTAGIPKPSFYYHASGFWVEIRKEIDLSKLSLNKRQLEAIKFFKEQKEISTSDYMKRYNISERTARYDLAELVKKNILTKLGNNKVTTYIFR